MPLSVCRVIVGLSSIFVSISLCCKSKSCNQTPISRSRSLLPALLLILPASLLTPPQEGKGGQRRGRVLRNSSSSKDKRPLTLQWPRTPRTPKDTYLSTQARHLARLSPRRMLWFLHIILMWLLGWVPPGLGKRSVGAARPPSPGLVGHSLLGAQHFKCCFLSVGPHLQFPRSPAAFP